MHVVHFCKSFSPLSQTFIYDYVTELKRQRVDSRVLTMQRLNEEDRPFGDVTVVPKPWRWNLKRLWYRLEAALGTRHVRTSSWPMLREALRRAVARMQPDILHAHFGDMGVLIAPVAAALGIPLVVSFYGHDVSRLAKRPFWKTAYEELWESVQAVTVLSQEMRQATMALGCPPGTISTVHLSRNLERFTYRPPRAAVKHFVSVGRLTEKKGHLDTIRALEQVLKHGHDVRLQIVGDGLMQETLSAYVQEHHLQEVVDLAGRLSNADVAYAMEQADAFILCSKTASDGDREGTPTVLVEAQAVGLPCISTFHAGIPEIIPEVNHRFLAEEGRVEDISDRIEKLLACSPSELGHISEAGRSRVEQAFNLEGEVEKLRGVYERASR